MKQALMSAPGQIVFRDVEVPTVKANEVLIQVKRIGICGSDVHVFHGSHPYTNYPIVQGHEISALVCKIGDSIRDFKLGDPVTIIPQITCGSCYPCRHGSYHICDSLKVMGFQADGAAQEFFAVSSDNVMKIPAELNLEQGAMVEPAAVAVHAIGRAGVVLKQGVRGKKVLVLGAGPIGNLVAQSAKAMGAQRVMITDLSNFRLQTAKACGIDCTVNPKEDDLQDALRQMLGEDRADLIMECVGSAATIEDAISVARKGSTIVIVGVFGQKPTIDLGLVQDRELNLLGTLMYQKKDFEIAMKMIAEGKIKLGELITHTFPFSQYQEAYRHIARAGDRAIKVLISL